MDSSDCNMQRIGRRLRWQRHFAQQYVCESFCLKRLCQHRHAIKNRQAQSRRKPEPRPKPRPVALELPPAPELDPGAGGDWRPYAEDVALFCWYGWRDCADSGALVLLSKDKGDLCAAADKLPRPVAKRLVELVRGNQ